MYSIRADIEILEHTEHLMLYQKMSCRIYRHIRAHVTIGLSGLTSSKTAKATKDDRREETDLFARTSLIFGEGRVLELDALIDVGEGEDGGVGMKTVEVVGGGSVDIGIARQQAILETTHKRMQRRGILVIIVVREGMRVVGRHSLQAEAR